MSPERRSLELIGAYEIRQSIGTDSALRFFLAKSIRAEVLGGLAETVSDSFQSRVARHLGQAGVAYERAQNDVGSVMNRLQK